MRRITILLLFCTAAALLFGCSEKIKTSPATNAPPEPVYAVIVTGGHDFEKEAFLEMFAALENIKFVHAPQQDASEIFEDISDWPYDVIVLYNMTQKISPRRRKNLLRLLEEGTGLLALHHSIAAFQDWPQYTRIIGGKYYLQKTVEGGTTHPPSSYKHDVTFTVRVKNKTHPITRGLSDFVIHDETYCNYSREPDNNVLLVTDEPTSDRQICWTRKYRSARVCYIQSGHGPAAYGNENYRKLVARAVKWCAKSPLD